MSAALTLVMLVAGAYLAARVAFEWLGRRFLIVSGAEYVLLGILVGPQVSGLLGKTVLQSFEPITTLALGWMGAIIGTRFYLAALVAVPGITYRLAFVESILTLLTVFGVEMAALTLLGFSPGRVWIPALAMGTIATASSTAAVDMIGERLGSDRPLVAQLSVSTTVNAFVAVIAFGILLSMHHPDPHVMDRPITPTEWMVIAIAVGIIGGSLFYLFLGSEEHEDRLLIALGGAVILVSGAAAYLSLSPLVVGLFFGIILVNTAANREEVTAVLESVDRPLYFVLLVIGGATWRPSTEPWALAIVVLFLAARAAGKLGGARLAARANGALPVLGNDWGQALLGQGGLALALAINYQYQQVAIGSGLVFTAAVVSVLLTDFLSARLMRAAVVSAEQQNGVSEPLSNETLVGEVP
ncbi:MAG: cation:proton antiporter [Gemmatimonadaceae bacterium]